jgi:hypothetical protein
MEFHPSDGQGNQAQDIVLMLTPGQAAENAEARKRAREMDKVRREADSVAPLVCVFQFQIAFFLLGCVGYAGHANNENSAGHASHESHVRHAAHVRHTGHAGNADVMGHANHECYSGHN